MKYKAKVAVCSDIRTKHSTQSVRNVVFLIVKPWWYLKKPLGFKRLSIRHNHIRTFHLKSGQKDRRYCSNLFWDTMTFV